MLWIPERLGLPKIKGDDQSKGHLTCVVDTLKCNTKVFQIEIVCYDLTYTFQCHWGYHNKPQRSQDQCPLIDDLSMTKCQQNLDSKQHSKLHKCFVDKTIALYITDIHSPQPQSLTMERNAKCHKVRCLIKKTPNTLDSKHETQSWCFLLGVFGSVDVNLKM